MASPAQPDNTAAGVLKWVNEQGYALEHKTAEAFRSHKYRVRPGTVYRSGDDRGEIDVVARAPLQGPYGFVVVVECKRSPNAWLIRKAELAQDDFQWSPIASVDLAAHLARNWTVTVQAAFPVEQPIAFDVVQAHKKPGGQNPPYEAMQQALDGAAALVRNVSQYPAPAFFHAVVVTDAPLYTLTYTAAGDPEILPTDWERVVVGSARSWGAPVAVDLVHERALEGLPKRLRFEFQDLFDALPQEPPSSKPPMGAIA